MKVLMFAYASEPGAGSEYGVGWMVPMVMAQRHPEHDIYVLTRSRCRKKIEMALNELKLKNLHYEFYDIPSWMLYKDEMNSKWGEQINYWLWQLKVRGFTKKLHKKVNFDIVHHITFNQYRTPSPGFWMDIPFVMGPIGGAETIAESFNEDLLKHTIRKEEIRRKGRDLPIFGWFMNRRKNKKVILCSCTENHRRLLPYCKGHDIIVMPAIAFSKDDFKIEKSRNNSSKFTLLYAGKAWDWKGIRIFLRAAKEAYIDKGVKDFAIKLVGIRFDEEQKLVNSWVKACGMEEYVELIPFIQRSELLKMMTEINLNVYPAFRDSGSMSILEASALACPTICFDAGGQDTFPDEVLLKIPIGKTYKDNQTAFADGLYWAYTHQAEAQAIGEASKGWVENNLTWNKKVDDFVALYAKMGSRN